nr:ankyrin repeat protein [Colletotrichum truncatum]KAF6783069.1 ankyrin repeat protein [Colletotrichum truncatum]
MATDPRPRRREDFRIAVLCALPLEYNAATLAFDEFWDEDGDKFGRARGDPNTYTTGRIGKYNVVLALLPNMGGISAASAMASIRSSYTELKLAILVGICGGVPGVGTKTEILLGDVIISKTVVQYDFGRQHPHKFTRKDTIDDNLGRPNKDIRSLLASLETERSFDILQRRTSETLAQIQQEAAQAVRKRKRTRYPYPGAAQDMLFNPNYIHRHRDEEGCGCDESWVCDTAPDASCKELECDVAHLLPRERLETKKRLEREGDVSQAQEPQIFIGRVGSGNTVMRSGMHRDSIAKEHSLIAFEMEATGAWDEVPCIVVKGVCDYADSHKNKKWQTFAAATAASTMKALLGLYIQTDTRRDWRADFSIRRNIEILNWISKEPYEQHHKLTRSEVLNGTGKWLLEDPTFLQWKNESVSSVLWLHGIPGSGKSKLTSLVVEDSQQAFQSSQSTALAYFYCSRNPAEPGRSDPASIAASIARQLAIPQLGGELLDAAVKEYTNAEDKAFASRSLTLVESQDLILRLLKSYKDHKIMLVIDALDECKEATRQNLLGLLNTLLEAPCLLKIFVSSRDDQDIVYNLRQCPNLFLSSERNSGDIDLFVRTETRRLIGKGSLLRGSARRDELHGKIVRELTSKAHGMFRWASLHIQELCRQTTDAAIEERLLRIPKTLEGLYQEILFKIENRDADADRNLARNAFIWLLCSREQLESDDFLAMVSRKDGSSLAISKDQLLDLCCNLVIFDTTLDAFRFSHLSVREFLENQYTYQTTTANAVAAEICLLNLAAIPSELASLTSLLEYSCSFWADHAQAAGQERQPRLNQILIEFFSGEQNPRSVFYRWHSMITQLFEGRGIYRSGFWRLLEVTFSTPSALLVICLFDLSNVLGQEHWRQLAKDGPRTIRRITHEEAAVLYGSIGILEWHFNAGIPFKVTKDVVRAMVASREETCIQVIALLLNKHGNNIQITEEVVNAAASNTKYGDIILAFLFEKRGHEFIVTDEIIDAAVQNETLGVDLVSLLLKQRGSEISITEDTIIAAAQNDKLGVAVITLLLEERGDEIGISEDTLIVAATRYPSRGLSGNFYKTIALLLNKCSPQIHITEDVILAIAGVVACGRNTMALLLDNCQDEIKITAKLFQSVSKINNAKRRNQTMVLLLDRFGAESQITNEIVEVAAEHFHDTILRKLIDIHGEAVRVTEEIIKLAAQNKYRSAEIIELLLEKRGHEVQITDEILKLAVQNEYSGAKLLELLFDKRGHEVQITKDIVHLASVNSTSGAELIMILLKNRGGQVQISENVLICAALQQDLGFDPDKELLRFLFDERKEEIQLTERVIVAAASNPSCNAASMRILLEKCGKAVCITDEVIRTAVRNQDFGDVIALLLQERGDDIQITETVLKSAVQNGHCGDKITDFLLQKRGDDIQITEQVLEAAVSNLVCGDIVVAALLKRHKDKFRVTEGFLTSILCKTLITASSMGHLEVVEVLLENRVDVSVADNNGWTPLHAASSNGHFQVVKALLENNADVSVSNNFGCTPLHTASYKGHLQVVWVLLENKAEASVADTQGWTPLHAASSNGHFQVVKALLENNADVSVSNNFGCTPLHTASYKGHLQVVWVLLENKAEASVADIHQWTPLHAASSNGHLEVVKALLESNADVSVSNDFGCPSRK